MVSTSSSEYSAVENIPPQDESLLCQEKHFPRIPGWPTQPETLPRRMVLKHSYTYIIDVFVALSPVSFLVLSIFAHKLDGKPISPWGEELIRVARLGTTIYPILFASVLGRALRMVARWRVEQGSTFGVLELLMGSQTLGGTVTTQISTLGTTCPAALGFGLVLLWLLSPLGGQSSLNLISKAGKTFTTTIWYLDTVSQISEINKYSTDNSTYNALYVVSLLSASKYASSMDIWENIKIPRLESFDNSITDKEEWISIQNLNKSVPFSSLIGIPVIGIPEEGTATFTLESTYLVFSCQDQSRITYNDPRWGEPLGKLYKNISIAFERSTFFLDTHDDSPRDETPGIAPRTVIFGSYSTERYGEPVALIYNCSVIQSYVETIVECTKRNCNSTHIRRSRRKHQPEAYTSLDIEYQGIKDVERELKKQRGSIEPYWQSTITECFIQYIHNPPRFGESSESNGTDIYVNLTSLSKEDFEEGFSLAFNTYWQATLAPHTLRGSLPKVPSALMVDSNKPEDKKVLGSLHDRLYSARLNESFAESNSTVTTFEDRYACNILWLSGLLVATSILLILSIVGTFLKWLCVGPDVLGYVSSLAMDNPYILLPPGGCTLDGSDRAKLIAKMKVGLRDVKKGGEVGHVALASLSGQEVAALEDGRLYMGCSV